MNATMLLADATDADYRELESMLLGFLDDVRVEATASDPLLRLRQIVAAHVRWRLERPEVAELFDVALGVRTRVSRLPGEHHRRVRAIKRMYLDELRAVLRAGARCGTFHFEDVRVTAFALVNLCSSAHTWYDPDGDLSIDQVATMYAELAAGMVRAPMRVV